MALELELRRLAKANKYVRSIMQVLKDIRSKEKLYRMSIKSTVVYGFERWTMKKELLI